MKTKSFILATLLICSFSFCTLSSFAQYTDLHDFDSTHGRYPDAALVSDGNFLYGMTEMGGTKDEGVIFRVNPNNGSGYMVLLNFDSINGMWPYGSLIYDGTYLYGMTSGGGVYGDGVIFKIKPDGSGYVDMHNFNYSTGDGNNPQGSLLLLGTYLYGMTISGGSNGLGTVCYGTVFKIKTDGTAYQQIYAFDGSGGADPKGSLITDGTFLYGMTNGNGGISMNGSIFKIKPDGSNFTELLDFDTTNEGAPDGSLVYDGTYLYGTTSGSYNCNNGIFKIKPDGSNYTSLIDFNDTDGSAPEGNLILDGTYLYGTTVMGGTHDDGTVFRIKPDGSDFATILNFDSLNGQFNYGSLWLNGSFLYGMTFYGGSNNDGLVFKLDKTTTGIEEPQQIYKTNLYPNPSTGIFTISTSERNAELKVMNVLGQEVFSEKLQQNNSTFNLSSQPVGVYFIQVNTQHGIITKKLVLQR